MTAAPPVQVLTVPTPEDHPAWLPTGNEWVSLPTLDPATAGLHSAGAVLLGRRGVVELRGEARRPGTRPLLRPVVLRGGTEVDLAAAGLAWERAGDWLPRFSVDAAGVSVRGTWCAPPGERGFLLLLDVSVASGTSAVRVGLDGCFAATELCLFQARRPPCENVLLHDPWTGALVLEASLAGDLLALAIASDAPSTVVYAAAGDAPLVPLSPGSALSAPNDGRTPLRFRLLGPEVPPGGHIRVAFLAGAAPERDGARTTSVHLRRLGAGPLLDASLAWLAARRRTCAWPELDAFLNRNLLFNRFFASGRALDTEEVVSLTSRSPAYYVSGATWERDSLLWSLPALILLEPAHAREVLLFLLRRHARNAGEHAHYLDGAVLYPGFELDQLAAYFVAIDRYLAATGDVSILAEPGVGATLRDLAARILARRHPDPGIELYSTFLLTSDDPSPHPFVTYDNALVARAFEVMAALAERAGDADRAGDESRAGPASTAGEYRARAARVREAVYARLVHPDLGVFSWSSDLAGDHRLYDEPSGSLLLLPYYGFCPPDDAVWRRTVEYLHSDDYAFRFGRGRFCGHGCVHYPDHPGLLGVAGSLLFGRREEALDVLRHAPLDGGLACETFDAATGEARTGVAFATCAGLVAWALAEAGAEAGPGAGR